MPRAGLTTEKVVREAAALADARGLEALTMAALADRLGVRSPSLYNHVGGVDRLRSELRAHALGLLRDRLAASVAGVAGGDAVRSLALAMRRFAAEHPALYELTVPAGTDDPPRTAALQDEVLQLVLAVLAGYRLQGEDAIHATRFLRSAVHGFVSLESAGGFGIALDLDASFERLVDRCAAVLAGWSRAGQPRSASR